MSRRALGIAALVVAVVACYAGAIDHDFVFDDVKLVVENETIRDLSGVPRILAAAFKDEPYLARDHWIDPGYRPVRMISYAIDHALFGPSPRGFRAMNLALHIVNALLVGAIAARIVARPTFLPAAFLFALHPLATEAVTYISGRRDVLFALFYLSSFVIFLDHRAREERWRPFAIVALFVLALGTKEMAVTLPLAIAGIDLALSGWRGVRRRAALHGTLFGVAAVYALLVVFLKNPGQAGHGIVVERIGGSALAAALTMARVVWHYIGVAFFPWRLCADYSFDAFPASRGLFTPWTTALAVAGLVAVAVAIVRLWRAGWRTDAFIGAFFFVSLVPVLQIIPHPEPIAERYLYLPLLAPILIFLRALVLLIRTGRPRTTFAILGLAILALGARTVVRNRDWRDEETLFASVVRTHPRCARANLAVAKIQIARGEDRAALDPLDRCIEVLPEGSWDSRAGGLLVTALFERAKARAEVGLHAEALRDLDRVLAERTTGGEVVAESPRFAHVRLNRAAVLRRKGESDAAAREYEATLRLLDGFAAPDDARAAAEATRREAKAQLGAIALERGENERGLALLKEAAGPRPPTAESERAWDLLGRAALAAGDLARAEDAFRELVAARLPGEKEAWYRLAEALDRRADLKGAREALERALALDPKFVAARFTLGDLALKLGDLDLAERELQAVLIARPDDKRVRLKLTEVTVRRKAAEQDAARKKDPPPPTEPDTPRKKAERLFRMAEQAWSAKQPEGAVKALRAAEAADPTWPDAPDFLGAVLDSLGRGEEAAKAYDRAKKLRGKRGPEPK